MGLMSRWKLDQVLESVGSRGVGGVFTEWTCSLYLCPDVTAAFRNAQENKRGSHRTYCLARWLFLCSNVTSLSSANLGQVPSWAPQIQQALWGRQPNQVDLRGCTWEQQGRLPGGGGWKRPRGDEEE